MSYFAEQPEFIVAVDGAFDGQRFWCVHGKLWARENLSVEARRRLSSEIKLEFLRGIARETRRGRSLGATSFRLRIEDGAGIVGNLEILGASFAELEETPAERAQGSSVPPGAAAA